jgi:hypothetical protein
MAVRSDESVSRGAFSYLCLGSRKTAQRAGNAANCDSVPVKGLETTHKQTGLLAWTKTVFCFGSVADSRQSDRTVKSVGYVPPLLTPCTFALQIHTEAIGGTRIHTQPFFITCRRTKWWSYFDFIFVNKLRNVDYKLGVRGGPMLHYLKNFLLFCHDNISSCRGVWQLPQSLRLKCGFPDTGKSELYVREVQ